MVSIFKSPQKTAMKMGSVMTEYMRNQAVIEYDKKLKEFLIME